MTMMRNLKNDIEKLKSINLATVGIVLLIGTTMLLAASFCIEIESNVPLWTAIIMMAIGVILIVIQEKKSAKY